MAMKHRHEPQSGEVVDAWKELSRKTIYARLHEQRESATHALRQQARAEPKAFFTPAYLVWMGDNLEQEARYEEAAEVFAGLARDHGDRALPFEPVRGAALALERQAGAYERLERWDEAADLLLKATKIAGGPSTGDAHYRLGKMAEKAGRRDKALDFYRKAKRGHRSPRQADPHDPADEAARAARRLERGAPAHTTPERVASALARALRSKDAGALRALASSTHFSIGAACSEREYVDRDKALAAIAGDLAASHVRLDPERLDGHGEKRYLLTEGWAGDLLLGRVLFLLTRFGDGWEWSGVALTQPGEGVARVVPPKPREENQPLAIPIKAPWPSGLCFRAGGLDRYLLAHAPFIGWAIFLEDNFSPCGYGPGGYHYNALFSHNGQDAFSIDFTRYVPGLPYVDAAGGQLVLACAEGMVRLVRANIASGDASMDNRVEISHWDVPLRCGGPGPRYISKYLHLAGPGQIPVSEFMWVAQGTRLGRMDDTGNSAVNHLHFSIHDRNVMVGGAPFGSVRPTPMDGRVIGDGDGGICICSTNVPVP